MEASKILEIINSVNMNDAERNTFDILTKWMHEHPDETTITTFEPAAALACLARIAEQELRENAVTSKLGSGAALVAKIVNKRMNSEKQSESQRHAYMGELKGEMYQIALLDACMMIALRERNDLIDTGNDNDEGEKLASIFKRNSKGAYYDLSFNPADIEAAYKLSRTRGIKPRRSTSKRYPPMMMNGKYYDTELVRDLLRIMGTDKLVWSQHESRLGADYIETSRGFALICPVKFIGLTQLETGVDCSNYTPIEVKSEVGKQSTVFIY